MAAATTADTRVGGRGLLTLEFGLSTSHRISSPPELEYPVPLNDDHEKWFLISLADGTSAAFT
jgi:hypothetical protein